MDDKKLDQVVDQPSTPRLKLSSSTPTFTFRPPRFTTIIFTSFPSLDHCKAKTALGQSAFAVARKRLLRRPRAPDSHYPEQSNSQPPPSSSLPQPSLHTILTPRKPHGAIKSTLPKRIFSGGFRFHRRSYSGAEFSKFLYQPPLLQPFFKTGIAAVLSLPNHSCEQGNQGPFKNRMFTPVSVGILVYDFAPQPDLIVNTRRVQSLAFFSHRLSICLASGIFTVSIR